MTELKDQKEKSEFTPAVIIAIVLALALPLLVKLILMV